MAKYLEQTSTNIYETVVSMKLLDPVQNDQPRAIKWIALMLFCVWSCICESVLNVY